MIYLGGILCCENCFCVGDVVVCVLWNLFIDIVFILVFCWGFCGILILDEDKVVVKWVVSEVSSKCVLLVDVLKYGKIVIYLVLFFIDFDVVIIDIGLVFIVYEELVIKEIELIIVLILC